VANHGGKGSHIDHGKWGPTWGGDKWRLHGRGTNGTATCRLPHRQGKLVNTAAYLLIRFEGGRGQGMLGGSSFGGLGGGTLRGGLQHWKRYIVGAWIGSMNHPLLWLPQIFYKIPSFYHMS
jgi:hypothetical protein